MSRFSKLRKVLVAAAALTVIALSTMLFAACSVVGDDNEQEPGVLEPDIVKVTDDGHIIKLQSDGMTATKVTNGKLEIVKSAHAAKFQDPIDLISYDKYMISLVKYGDDHLEVAFYDMRELNDGTDRLVALRSTMFFGEYFTCRIYDGKFYLIARSASTYLEYNEKLDAVVETGADDYIFDSVEGKKKFTKAGKSKDSRGCSGFLMAKVGLDDLEQNEYTLSSYRDEEVSDLYFSPHGIYLIKNWEVSKGCSRKNVHGIVRVDVDDFTIKATLGQADGTIPNRYCLYDNGENLFAVSFYESTSLTVYDKDFERKTSVGHLAPGEEVKSVRFNTEYCYVTTFREVDPLYKINITDPSAPAVLGYAKIEGYSTMMVEFGDSFLVGVGYSAGQSTGVQVTLFDITEPSPYEINSVVLDAQFTNAASNTKAICSSFENNLFIICTENGAEVVRIDEYGFLEKAAQLPLHIVTIDQQEKTYYLQRTAIIDGYIATISAGRIETFNATTFDPIDSIVTKL